MKPLIVIALIWKLFTEFLYVPADTVTGMGIINIFEWIERWGDYGIPVAMLYILSYKQAKNQTKLDQRLPQSDPCHSKREPFGIR